jgi:non-canonical (house-cleaning) NTP pyrophosphatase
MSSTLHVFVGSKSALKLKATEGAFQQIFREHKIKVEGFDAPSDVNSQPIGNAETLLGAQNRLKHTKEILAKQNLKFDFVASVENGLIEVVDEAKGGQHVWFDLAWIVVEDANGKQGISSSGGLQFPTECVLEAQKKGFATTTAGSIIATKFGAESTNPHKFLTENFAPREIILQQATVIAIANLLHKQKH